MSTFTVELPSDVWEASMIRFLNTAEGARVVLKWLGKPLSQMTESELVALDHRLCFKAVQCLPEFMRNPKLQGEPYRHASGWSNYPRPELVDPKDLPPNLPKDATDGDNYVVGAKLYTRIGGVWYYVGLA